MNDRIARPGRDEAIEYYFKYIDLVPDGDIRDILEGQRQETLAFLESIPESKASHRYGPDKWTIADVVGHISDCERLFEMRSFWFARAMGTDMPSFEQDDAVVTAKANAREWATHIHEFGAVRGATVALFRNLPEEAWSRRGIASGNEFTVRALAYCIAGHVIHHLQILRERYLQ